MGVTVKIEEIKELMRKALALRAVSYTHLGVGAQRKSVRGAESKGTGGKTPERIHGAGVHRKAESCA